MTQNKPADAKEFWKQCEERHEELEKAEEELCNLEMSLGGYMTGELDELLCSCEARLNRFEKFVEKLEEGHREPKYSKSEVLNATFFTMNS